MLKFVWIGGWVLTANKVYAANINVNDAWARASMPLRLDMETADHQHQPVNVQAAVRRMEAQHHGQ